MGSIDLQRGDWAPFLPRIEHSYGVRYRQHFGILEQYPTNCPSGRKFYEQPWVIDAGSEMYKRLMNKEKNVISLLEFGWKIIGYRLMPPDTFWNYLEMLYAGLHNRYIVNGSSYDDLPIPAIQFVRIEKTGNVLEDNRFVRAGLDNVPDPDAWQLAMGDEDGVIDVPLPLFSEIYCQNRPPMNPVMFDHDNSHIMDYLNNQGYYNTQQEVFARVCGRHTKKPSLHISECPSSGNPYTAYGRVCCMHEETCLPDVNKAGTIKYALEVSSSLRDYKARGRFLSKAAPALVIRHGGGMNDPYNLYNDLNIRTIPKQRVDKCIQEPSARFFHSTGRELFSQLAVESMLGLASDIECLSERNGINYERLLVEKIERLETAFKIGVELKMTVNKFVLDTTEQVVDPNSDSYRWLASFMPRHSLHAEFYLSQAAIGG